MKRLPQIKRHKQKKTRRDKIAWFIPHRPKLKKREEEFCGRVDAIWEEYHQRRQQEALNKLQPQKSCQNTTNPPYDTADGFFKRQIYALCYEYENATDGKMIRNIVERYAYSPESPSFDENRYHWTLIAIFTIEGISGKKEVTAAKKKIWRLANEMLYARRNNIKAEHLVGFLYQSACSKNISSLLENRFPDPSLTLHL